MLMKIRSARLYFLGNLIYFSCMTVSLTPVFQVLGHRKLHVSALGLVWPWSELLSLGPCRVTLCRQGGHGLCGMGWERSEAFGSSSARPVVWLWLGTRARDPQDGHRPPLLPPRDVPCPPKSHHKLPSAPHGGACGKSYFSFQNNPRRVRCQGEGCEEPRRFIAEEILSPARADGRSRNNGRFAT